ncbi:MAG: hypothetical protein ACRD2F_03680, partial [Terriglobales bacterium]
FALRAIAQGGVVDLNTDIGGIGHGHLQLQQAPAARRQRRGPGVERKLPKRGGGPLIPRISGR